MTTTLEAVRLIELAEIKEARERIAGTIVRTPLIRLELGPNYPDIRLKLENLQPINAYKLRGAANAVAMLSESERARGVWTISAGNAGQGVAYAARKAGVPCAVVAIETVPLSKLERMKALGAKLILVSYDDAWKDLEARAFPGLEGNFVHQFNDHNCRGCPINGQLEVSATQSSSGDAQSRWLAAEGYYFPIPTAS